MALAVICGIALAFPLEMPCGRALAVDTAIMGSPAQLGTALASFSGKSCGGTYSAGETLQAEFSGTGRYVMEVSGGAIFGSGVPAVGCSGVRYHQPSGANDALSIDSSGATGAITIWTGYSAGYGTVSITPSCTLYLAGAPLVPPLPPVSPPLPPRPPPAPAQSMSRLFWVHAICMGLAWLVLAPLGVQIARFGREEPQVTVATKGQPAKPASWFVWHRRVQTVSSVLMLVGLVTVYAAVDSDGIAHVRNAHGSLGLLTLLLLLVQVPQPAPPLSCQRRRLDPLPRPPLTQRALLASGG